MCALLEVVIQQATVLVLIFPQWQTKYGQENIHRLYSGQQKIDIWAGHLV